MRCWPSCVSLLKMGLYWVSNQGTERVAAMKVIIVEPTLMGRNVKRSDARARARAMENHAMMYVAISISW